MQFWAALPSRRERLLRLIGELVATDTEVGRRDAIALLDRIIAAMPDALRAAAKTEMESAVTSADVVQRRAAWSRASTLVSQALP
jgi:hypothetical protein